MSAKILLFILILVLIPVQLLAVDPLYLKKNDLQPYYYAQIVDADNDAVNITGATIYCTMKKTGSGARKIDRKTTGINISDGTNGEFEYRWQSGDTNTIGEYYIEFEINPLTGGKYTVPTREQDRAIVWIRESLDTQ